MAKKVGMNKHQKKVYRVGERRVGKEQVGELLVMTHSQDAEERLAAVELLCPCHVRTRIEEVWEAIYRLMEDPDWRVRRQAWHTIEDGGKPSDPAILTRLNQLRQAEADPKVKKFIEFTWRQTFGTQLEDEERARLWSVGRERKERGKCDFCGESDVFVTREMNTLIPTDGLHRTAWICERCAA